jgi:hypothetical protein
MRLAAVLNSFDLQWMLLAVLQDVSGGKPVMLEGVDLFMLGHV